MSILVKRFQSAKGAVSFLENLALKNNDTIVFRGHQKEEYRLVNTWQRHSRIAHESRQTYMDDIDEALTAYKVGLEKLGLESFDHESRFEAMEHGRHHGVPTPCLDFSYSPYVALFFAFNGVRGPRKGNSYSVVYALNIKQLAHEWAKKLHDPLKDQNAFYEAFWSFQYPKSDYFENGFPTNALQFIPFPGRRSKRMQRQLGCFLYDTQHYRYLRKQDLEDYLASIEEPKESAGQKTMPGKPVLTKVLINQKATPEIFSRLELMNITGGHLYDNAEGVALDIKNAYNYNPKFSYLRDVQIPQVDVFKR